MEEIESTNPFSEKVLKSYPVHGKSAVDVALQLSDAAFKKWKQTSLVERALIVTAFGELLRENKKDLAELATLEMGKPLKQALAEIEKCADLCDFYTEKAPDFLKNKVISESGPRKLVSYQPMGCVLAVMPWNYPFWQVIRFAVPTLMAGNVALLKHASNVSGCALKIEELLLKSGLEKGVFQTLILPSDRIEKLIEAPIVKAVSLTGSGPAGSAVAKTAGENIKKTVLELGGSDPYLILADADLDLAAKACVQSRLQNNGQSCIAAKRFIVHESVYEDFTKKVIHICKQQKYGDPLDLSTDIGPLATVSLAEELSEQVEKSINMGAKLVHQQKLFQKSKAFFPITILDEIPVDSPAYKDEFFGPVFSMFKFSKLEDALRLANDSQFGLGGGVFTSDLELGFKIAETGIDSGSVFVNDFTKSDFELPFGGVRDSGIGRELSSFGIHEFVNIKSVCIAE